MAGDTEINTGRSVSILYVLFRLFRFEKAASGIILPFSEGYDASGIGRNRRGQRSLLCAKLEITTSVLEAKNVYF